MVTAASPRRGFEDVPVPSTRMEERTKVGGKRPPRNGQDCTLPSTFCGCLSTLRPIAKLLTTNKRGRLHPGSTTTGPRRPPPLQRGPDPLRRPLDSSTTFTRAPHHRGRPFAKHPAGRPEAPRGASRTRAGAPIAVKTTELRQKQRRSKGQAPRHDEGDPGLLSPPPLLGSSPGRSHK